MRRTFFFVTGLPQRSQRRSTITLLMATDIVRRPVRADADGAPGRLGAAWRGRFSSGPGR